MGTDYIKEARGIRKVSPVVVVAAAGVAEAIFTISALPTVPRTLIVRKIMAYSDVGNCTILLSTAVGFPAGIIPHLYVLNLFDAEWHEDEINEVEVNETILVTSDILGVEVQIEVEVIGS